MSDLEKRQFIIKTTMDATKLAQTKMSRLKIRIDFDQLFKDIEKCASEYLKLTMNDGQREDERNCEYFVKSGREIL
jgi:hypothetical protein